MRIEDEDLLLAVLNRHPIHDGESFELLEGEAGRELVAQYGGTASAVELENLRQARDGLQGMVRSEEDAGESLSVALRHAALVPEVTASGVRFDLQAPADEVLAARAVLAWSRVQSELPGRLRACANTECNLFLLDHSRPGTAKWCSMAACGNRMKARNHARRQQRG